MFDVCACRLALLAGNSQGHYGLAQDAARLSGLRIARDDRRSASWDS